MRTAGLALFLLLISSGTSAWAQVSILDNWIVDGSYATQDASFNVSAGTRGHES